MAVKNTIDFDKGARAIIDAAEKVMRGTMFTLYSGTTMDTPVDTGRLRSNWQITVDQPANFSVFSTSRTNQTPALNSYTIDKTLYLTNNLVYARIIEEGDANRQPNFMLKRNFARVKSSMARQAAIYRVK